MTVTVGSPRRRLQSLVGGLRVQPDHAEPRTLAAMPVAAAAKKILPSRPAVQQRCFVSKAVEEAIEDIGGRMVNKQLAVLFQNALPNTLDTTVYLHSPKEGDEDSCESASQPGFLRAVLTAHHATNRAG